MKKTLALLICLAMLFTALSVNVFAAETNAKVTVVADATQNNKANFAVKLTGFNSLKGVDLKITGTGLTFEENVTATGLEINLEKDVNYKVSGNQIHIVELTDWKNNDVVIKATANLANDATAHKITVDACKLAKDGTTLYKVDTDYTFDSEIPVASAIKDAPVAVDGKTEITQSDAGDGYFIPYGGVSNDGVSVEKDGNGNFTEGISNTTTVLKFPKPANGITTFGVSESTVSGNPARQFGTYVNNYDSTTKQYGSMVLVGDWDDFVSAYKAKYKDAYISEIVAKLYDVYVANISDKQYVLVSVRDNGGTKHSVKIYKVAQNNYMWKNETDKILEYAVRVYGLEDNTTYTSVAYNADKGTGANPVFSAAIKSETYTKTSAQ